MIFVHTLLKRSLVAQILCSDKKPKEAKTASDFPTISRHAVCSLIWTAYDSLSSSGSADSLCSRTASDHHSAPVLQKNMLVPPPPIQDHGQTSTWTVLNNLTQTRQCLSYRPLHRQPLLKTVFGRGLVADRQRTPMN